MWKYASYEQRGLSHIRSGAGCQDRVLIKENQYCVVAALADGLGSLKHSEFVAETVTETVCDCFLRADFPEDYRAASFLLALRDALVREIKTNVSNQARKANLPVEDMDSTLVFVYLSKQKNYAIAGRLGDSAICVVKESGSIAINDGNQSANGTNAILDADSNEHLQLFVYDLEAQKILGFLLTSDGLENELYMKGSSHVNKAAEKYFNAVSMDPEPEKAIAAAVQQLTSEETSPFDDDISLAVISRADGPISFGGDPTWLCSCGARNRLQDTYCRTCGKDFTLLYANIRFKDYGGKAAFFEQMNTDPDAEKKLVGQQETRSMPKTGPEDAAPSEQFKVSALAEMQTPPGVCSSDRSRGQIAERQLSQRQGGGGQSGDRVAEPPASPVGGVQRKRSPWLWIAVGAAAGAVVLGTLLAILLSKKPDASSSKRRESTSETASTDRGEPTKPTSSQSTEPPTESETPESTVPATEPASPESNESTTEVTETFQLGFYKTSQTLNIRREPRISDNIFAILQEGAEVVVLKKAPDFVNYHWWVLVCTNGAKYIDETKAGGFAVGWIITDHLEPVLPPQSALIPHP